MNSRVAIYARVSTSDQSTESQLLDLRRYVRGRGWHIFNEYCDNGVSGTKEITQFFLQWSENRHLVFPPSVVNLAVVL